ncbi:MAG: membrane protein insertase YidC [Mariprofundaceae bacterium]
MEQRNMIMAFVLSMLVLVSWQSLFPSDPVQDQAEVTQTEDRLPDSTALMQATVPMADDMPDASLSSQPQPMAAKTENQILSALHNDVLSLQLNNQGAVVSATTTQYRQTMEPDSVAVSVLNSTGEHPLYINAGVLGQAMPVFTVDTVKQGQDSASVHLKTTLRDGNLWLRTISLKSGSYVVEMHDRIAGSADYEMFHQVVARHPDRDASNIYQFVGPVSLLEDKLIEHSYDDLDEESPIKQKARGGWTGIMEPYFIAALLSDSDRVYDYYYKGNGTTYQAGRLTTGERDGRGSDFITNIYIGPKATTIMKSLNIGLERSVDYGWFAVISKPLHNLLIWLYAFLGNYGLCIIVLVLMIKTIFYWPTQKAYESMADMRKLQPEMTRMRELHGDDRQKMGQEMMALYKKNKVNPMGGCLPIVIQIPVFFALYKALLVSIELRQAPFYGWITDLSAMDPYYVLPIVMGASMIIQQRLNPAPPDPLQAKVMKFLPILFTFMFLFFPSGLVLYWLVNNILAIAQQWYILKVKGAL